MIEILDNIREIYKFCQPCEELAPYIEFLSESCMEKTSRLITTERFSVKMFQSWTPTLWFNLGTPYHIEVSNRSHFVGADDNVLILRNTTVTRHVSSNDRIFSIKFFPGGLEAVLGINQSALINKIIPLKSFIPGALLHAVKREISYEGRIKLLEEYFLRNLKEKKNKDHYIKIVKDAMNVYQAEHLSLNTSEVAEKIFVTSRTINRYFNNVVGVNPKKYFSVVRARAALTQYVAGAKQFDPSLFGYYDISHFHKDIISFTGQKPSTFLPGA
jgi:AraC-like DNA-binding protein